MTSQIWKIFQNNGYMGNYAQKHLWRLWRVKSKNEGYHGKLDQKLSLHAKEHHCISKTLAVSPPPYIKLVPV